ncbi:MAG: hypothetical protein QOD60_1297 [Solirubrobacterales bacterium]|jgi:hypothetical protein|nr:hypothetical protein [Solirubrobacterales bacterium]
MSESSKPDDTRDALRKIGGLLVGLGALMILIRKSQDWGDFPLFLVLAIPAVLLYGLGVNTVRDTGEVRPWQAVYTVFGLILVPFALTRFVNLIGGSAGADLNVFWVFAVTAGLGVYAGHVVGVRFGLLAASIAAIVSWTALWDKILGDQGINGHIGTYRGLLGVLAILLLIAGIRLWRATADKVEGQRKFSEFLTGAGIAAVLGCGLGISTLLTLFPIPFTGGNPIGTSALWDVLLLVVSIALVGLGSNMGVRGPVYVGAIGLLLFLLIAGLDLNSKPPHPTHLGLWPLILLIGGGGAIALSTSEGVSLGVGPRQWIRRITDG